MFSMTARTGSPQVRRRKSRPFAPIEMEPTPTDGRRARGLSTRNSIVLEAVQLASTDGLGGLTMAVLAERLGVPKSSVHAAFGSKNDLQLAVLQEARKILIEHVIAPSLLAPAGNARLIAVGQSWIGYLEKGIFEGGCVLSSAASEIDAKPGPARDAVAAIMTEWLEFLAGNVRTAVHNREFTPQTDADQVAFQLHSIGYTANWHHQLFGGTTAFKRARSAWTQILKLESRTIQPSTSVARDKLSPWT
jgi:AcrR family transcriptional regulator